MKKIRKLLCFSCGLAAMIACALAVGCSCGGRQSSSGFESNSGSQSSESFESISSLLQETLTPLTLSTEALNMIIGDVARLNAWCTLETGVELQYESSNKNVLTVDGDGYMTAITPGEATVTVTYGTQQKTCAVTVTFGGMSPVLTFCQIDTSDPVSLALGDRLNLEPKITFNQKTFDDMQITYTVTGNIGKVTDDVFEASSVGDGSILAIATWRGLDGETVATLQKRVDINVTYSVGLIPNAKEYMLYTVSNYNGQSWDTETEFTVKVDDNGKITTADNIYVSAGENVVAYDASKNVIRALSHGSATLTIEYTDDRNEFHTKMVEVVVERPVKTIDGRKEFSSVDGTLDWETLFGESVMLTEAWQDGKKVGVENNKVYGLTMNKDSVTLSNLTVYTDTVGISVDIEGYGKVIRTAEDLKVFDIVDNDDNYKTESGKQITGYFVLANDIVNDPTTDDSNRHTGLKYNKAIGATGSDPDWLSSTQTGFAGTFDGQGYTMAFDVYQAGLFGAFLDGAVVKNVAMHVTMKNTEADTMSTVLAVQAPNASAALGVTIENVYVKIDDFRSSVESRKTSGLIYYRSMYTYVRNTVIELSGVVCNENAYASGALFGMDNRQENQASYIQNVVVISNVPMFMAMDENVNDYHRHHKTVACTDVTETGNEDDKNTVYDEQYTLKYALGPCTLGQWIMTKGKTVATGGNNIENVYCVLGASRYDSLAQAIEAGKTTIGNWQIGATGIGWIA